MLDDGTELELRPMPDEEREHALDPRVYELTQKRLSGAFVTPAGVDFEAMRKRPNKENHDIDSGGVTETVETMHLTGRDGGDVRDIELYVFTPEEARGAPLPWWRSTHGGRLHCGATSHVTVRRCAILRSRRAAWSCSPTTASRRSIRSQRV